MAKDIFQSPVTTVGWEACGSRGSLSQDNGSIIGKDVLYTRSQTCADPHCTVVIKLIVPNALVGLDLNCNAKFVEVYVQNGGLLKYQCTLRGIKSDAANSFCFSTKDSFECRELHLKFLSIKPIINNDNDAKDAGLQLLLDSIQLELAPANSTPAESLQTPSMLNMMAMSMGMKETGSGGGSNSAGMSALLGMTMASMSAHGRTQERQSAHNPNKEVHQPNKDTAVREGQARDKLGSSTEQAHCSASGVEGSIPVATPPPAAKVIPASGGGGGLDVSQLASILWTVKGSIVEELGAQLDQKLDPVLRRLDKMDARIEALAVKLEDVAVSSRCQDRDSAEDVGGED